MRNEPTERHAFYLDVGRCTGCFACTVACMDQNDLEVGPEPAAWRQVFAVETGSYPDAHLRYVSLACMHCEDGPCLDACPTGALRRDPATQVVRVEQDLCIGCHSCSIACAFGVPRFGADGKMQKCDLCSERLKNGLEPACVRVCPTQALRQGSPNDLALDAERRAAEKLAGDA
jgi:anaerobic dimethyl sulfoxide reductase subunit B (iron-sulfur subunit)